MESRRLLFRSERRMSGVIVGDGRRRARRSSGGRRRRSRLTCAVLSQIFGNSQRESSMKAIQVHEFGAPDVMKLEEIPTPKPGPGQVLVRVKAVGVNPYDTYMRSGGYAIKPSLPYTPRSDAAGTVETVGAGVSRVKPGDRGYTGRSITGAHAEFAMPPEAPR